VFGRPTWLFWTAIGLTVYVYAVVAWSSWTDSEEPADWGHLIAAGLMLLLAAGLVSTVLLVALPTWAIYALASTAFILVAGASVLPARFD